MKKYFGDYRKNNTNLLIKFIKNINKHVLLYFSPKYPFFSGNFEFKYHEYLKKRTLNSKSLSVDAVFKDISFLFQNLPNWGNPGTMLNVIPPVNIASLVASFYAGLYNPNFSQDRYSGLLLTSELEVVKYISDLVGWDWEKSHGIFTFGGKGTNLYATKVALNRAYPIGKKQGNANAKFFIISSKKGHPCHIEAADWLGIGSENCFQVDCDKNGQIILEDAEKIICKNIEKGKIFLGFDLTGGSTVEFEIDPIKKISFLRNKIKNKYNLKYSPFIHVDCVIAWMWLFFKYYNFEKNHLNIDNDILNKIFAMTNKISDLRYADSFGVDFHKTGFCPNISSLFIVKNREDIYNLGDNKKTIQIKELKFGNFSPFESSLELSRSCIGAVSALTSLKTLGIQGFQKIIIQLLSTSEFFRKELGKINFIEVLNGYSGGFATLLILKPKNFENNTIEEILKLPKEKTDLIKEYNLNYALYVHEKNKTQQISFTLTASDAFNVVGTNVCLGTQKAYPMSVFTTKKDIKAIIKEMISVKKDFDKEKHCNLEKIENNPVDMVYRK